jgi:serine/threonine protein kinase
MDEKSIREKIKKTTGISVRSKIEITDTAPDFLSISRWHVLQLEGKYYVILGNMFEGRFSLEEYQKYWVKSAIELSSGEKKVLKWEFNEEFVISIGPLNIRCYRSAEKESEVLKLVKNNPSFMQGKTVCDEKGTCIKVLEFISGQSIYNYLINLDMTHEKYFHEVFPTVLRNLVLSIEAISYLHTNGFCHGDIRNDHIIMDSDTNTYRWIDFDLKQDYSDFDVWSIGNILLFAAGMGEHTFKSVIRDRKISKKIKNSLCEDDASAFFKHRIMNLKKIFPYVPEKLNNIFMYFSVNTTVFYNTVPQILNDLNEALDTL